MKALLDRLVAYDPEPLKNRTSRPRKLRLRKSDIIAGENIIIRDGVLVVVDLQKPFCCEWKEACKVVGK